MERCLLLPQLDLPNAQTAALTHTGRERYMYALKAVEFLTLLVCDYVVPLLFPFFLRFSLGGSKYIRGGTHAVPLQGFCESKRRCSTMPSEHPSLKRLKVKQWRRRGALEAELPRAPIHSFALGARPECQLLPRQRRRLRLWLLALEAQDTTAEVHLPTRAGPVVRIFAGQRRPTNTRG